MAQRSAQQTLRRLTVIVAIQWMGATLGLPLLPLYLEHRGGTPSVIGIIQAMFFVAGVLTQFAFGHLADRFGRRKILVGSLVTYGLASMTFLLPVSAPWLMVTRAFQGAAAGAIEVASLSAVASLFAESERGRAVSRIFAAQLFGLAIGPVVGVLASVNELGWAFFVTGLVSLCAALVAMRTNLGDVAYDPTPLPKMQWSSQLTGSLFSAAASGLAIGVYETCWSLLMHVHHASTLQIRLSWTFFGLPWIVLSGFGGWLADHANRRVIALAGLLSGAFFLSLYPHIHNNNLILFLGSCESIGASLSVPSISSLMSQGAVHRELGRRQGLYTMSNTGSLAIAAGVSGFLFTIDSSLPFTLLALVSALLALSTLFWWRNVNGHVRPEPAT
ncbi:MAG TPA: MFS transporter [Acidimicrobiales bacterium]|jgi:DHA1 family multidrug resistance protein-like MFS transporter|nr:MFS transporter [Acidimicrobiales bacterium]